MSNYSPVFSQWGFPVEPGQPLIIAGPCSAESREQLLLTANAMRSYPVHLFRAGVWTPRSHLEAAAGTGNVALEWLQEVRQETGLKLAVEVATPQQLKEVLQADIDVLWIGARTTVNPFAVQELANALAGVDKPVLVKNPITPDLEVWFGAMERLQNKGVKKLGVILRGFVHRRPSKWRFEPEWELARKFRSEFPSLPYICDPSHIAGNASMIQDICQQAMDLDYHGLMVETHYDPSRALSDVEQQLNPEQLGELLSSLRLKPLGQPENPAEMELQSLRLEIDRIDQALLENFAARLKLSQRLGAVKKELRLLPLQSSRWNRVLQQAHEYGQQCGLSDAFIRDIFNRIRQESIRQQE
ncbi:MAG: 3-deoxy-7-phosphoheptulonate synthase [Oligosphaeraceae bacterium]|nr:3-deoxy-7-phosphoheptulonate synthase [Oligosphaeraceae bacterium]